MFFRLLLSVALLALFSVAANAQWARLKEDGLHDPKSPGVAEKQEPAEALAAIAAKAPDSSVGNGVNWVKALDLGVIQPRTNLYSDTKIRVLDQDIYLDIGGSQAVVKFPHRQHTMWLDCANCHDAIFQQVPGATDISMMKILEGEQCGVCHGAVAFPLTECGRCHSVPQADFPAIEKRLSLKRFGKKNQVAK